MNRLLTESHVIFLVKSRNWSTFWRYFNVCKYFYHGNKVLLLLKETGV